MEPVEIESPHVDLDPADGLWFQSGHPVLVLLAVSESSVTVAEPGVRWVGQTPVLHVRSSERHPLGPTLATWLTEAVPRMVTARRARFRTCEECGEEQPPEWMDDGRICQGCAQRNHGVVY